MRKITMTLAAAALVLGSLAVANAQTQGASKLNAQAQNATPIVKFAACRGWGRCPPAGSGPAARAAVSAAGADDRRETTAIRVV